MKKRDLKGIMIIGLLYLLIEAVGMTCPIKFLTGISCAGCGMSRAWLALLGRDVPLAFSFHPLLLLPIPAILLLVFRKKLPRRVFVLILGSMAAAFLAVYVLRMLDPADNVVVFRPREGIVWRAAEFVVNTIF